MKPYIHSQNSVRKYGGKSEDYQPIHDFMDSSKAVVPDMRHRAIFHSAFGCFIVEKVFGTTIKNSDGKIISTRDIAEDHILEDLGKIPTLQDWLSEMSFQDWMLSPDLREKEKKREVEKLSEPIKTTNLENNESTNNQIKTPPEIRDPKTVVVDGKRGTGRFRDKRYLD